MSVEPDIWRAAIDRRDFLKAGLLGATGVALAACGTNTALPGTGAAATPKLNYPKAQIDGDLEFFNWSQYLSDELIKGFEKEYGVKVNQTNFDNMQGMMAKLNAGVAYDVTFPTMDFAYGLVKAGALLPIDHSQLTNWKEVPSYFQNPWYDPHATYSVPYALWTTGIAWRADQVQNMAGSWSDLWNHPEASGKIFLLDDFQEVLGMSLLRLKYDINSKKRDQLDQAVAEVLKVKPMLRGFSTDDITNLVNGSAFIHHAWSGDVYQVLQQVNNPQDYKYETAWEGVPTGNDTFVIPKAAKHPGTALKFIDWMLAPDHSVTNVKFFGYPQVTAAGLDAYTTLVKDYPFLNMTLDQAIHGLREIVPTGSTLQLWDSEWTKIKAG